MDVFVPPAVSEYTAPGTDPFELVAEQAPVGAVPPTPQVGTGEPEGDVVKFVPGLVVKREYPPPIGSPRTYKATVSPVEIFDGSDGRIAATVVFVTSSWITALAWPFAPPLLLSVALKIVTSLTVP